MSKRDYIDFAAALLRAVQACESEAERIGVGRAAHQIANVYAERTASFDKARFLEAAGVQFRPRR